MSIVALSVKSVRSVCNFKISSVCLSLAALYAESGGDGGENGDDELD